MTASEFIAQHTGICYCEAVIAPDGSIEYAIPGHVDQCGARVEG